MYKFKGCFKLKWRPLTAAIDFWIKLLHIPGMKCYQLNTDFRTRWQISLWWRNLQVTVIKLNYLFIKKVSLTIICDQLVGILVWDSQSLASYWCLIPRLNHKTPLSCHTSLLICALNKFWWLYRDGQDCCFWADPLKIFLLIKIIEGNGRSHESLE